MQTCVALSALNALILPSFHYVQKQQLAVPPTELLIDASPRIVSHVISFEFVCLIRQGRAA